jgi:hypothetical protein
MYTHFDLQKSSLLFQFEGAPLEFADVLADLNLIFTAMFTVECALKISSFGPKVALRLQRMHKQNQICYINEHCTMHALLHLYYLTITKLFVSSLKASNV